MKTELQSRTTEQCVVNVERDGKRQTLTYSSHIGRTRVRWQFDGQSSSFAPMGMNTAEYDQILALVEGK